MTIPDSLAAIAKARPDLITRGPRDFCVGGRWLVLHSSNLYPEQRAMLLLWALETAAREGISLEVGSFGDCYYADTCGAGEEIPATMSCPTQAALAALAAALTTTEEAT